MLWLGERERSRGCRDHCARDRFDTSCVLEHAVRSPAGPAAHSNANRVSRFSARAELAGFFARPVSAKASSNFLACFGAFVSVHEIPFSRKQRFQFEETRFKCAAIGWENQTTLVLAGPFGRAGRRGG